MDLRRSAEHEAMLEAVTAFVDAEIVPRAAEIDRTDAFPSELIDAMGELGLLGMPIDEADGGTGLAYPTYAACLAEISRGSGAVGTSVAAHTSLCAAMIDQFGDAAQCERYLPALCEGSDIGAFALSEAGAGSDVRALDMTATRIDDGYRLEGEKLWTSNGSVASTIVTFARTGEPRDREGITAFIVRPAEDAGFSVARTEEKLGDRGCPTAALSFDGVELPLDRRLGAEGDGFHQALETLNGGRITIAARGVGIARAALDAAVTYALEREQFGRPIAEIQTIHHKLADMACKVRLAELAMWDAADRHHRGEDYIEAAAIAKLYASEVSREVSNEAIQIHGGYGYVQDFPVERYYRDAKLNEIYEGTSEILKNTIAHQLLE